MHAVDGDFFALRRLLKHLPDQHRNPFDLRNPAAAEPPVAAEQPLGHISPMNLCLLFLRPGRMFATYVQVCQIHLFF